MLRPGLAVLFTLAPTLVPTLALAHAALTGAAPSADSVAQGSPVAVELSFSEGIEPKFSRIMVNNAAGQRVDANDPHVVDDNQHLAVSLKNLLPGKYLVTWKAVAVDTHVTQGSYSFTVSQ
jgi:methionine-rich copper-binding protein CopC